MKVGIVTYPMLWQRRGGLQVQILQTIRHLRKLGVNAQLIDCRIEKLADFDVVHIFSAAHGNHLAVESSKASGVPSVLSPVMQPEFSAMLRVQLELATKLAWWISGRQTRTTFANHLVALRQSNYVVALSRDEAAAFRRIYRIPSERISIIGNGIDTTAMATESACFLDAYSLKPGYLLVVGSISAYKNQINAVRAAKRLGRQLVLIGPVGDRDYLSECLQEGSDCVRYIGEFNFDDPLLHSAYQHAAATILTSRGEAFGLTIAESLAAGVPGVITPRNGLGIDCQNDLLAHAGWNDTNSLCEALNGLAEPSDINTRRRCQQMVSHLSWQNVARQLIEVYRRTVAQVRPQA